MNSILASLNDHPNLCNEINRFASQSVVFLSYCFCQKFNHLVDMHRYYCKRHDEIKFDLLMLTILKSCRFDTKTVSMMIDDDYYV